MYSGTFCPCSGTLPSNFIVLGLITSNQTKCFVLLFWSTPDGRRRRSPLWLQEILNWLLIRMGSGWGSKMSQIRKQIMKCEHLQHFAKLILQVLRLIRNVDPSHRGITHPERTQDVVVLREERFQVSLSHPSSKLESDSDPLSETHRRIDRTKGHVSIQLALDRAVDVDRRYNSQWN
jgi:hypothetical protein